MPFRTKIDFSDNRQVKQRIETIQNLSGATTFGVPFSALPTGPDLTTTGITQTYLSVASTFSGNSGTTIYSWGDSRMSLGEVNLSAITPSNSATTQNTGSVFTADTTTLIDNNLVTLTYTGVNFSIVVTGMTDLGGGNYSGDILTNSLKIISASTLDFTGRTIWNDTSGITRTERLIVTNNPQVGYVLTCADIEGMASWSPSSGSTGSTDYYTTGATLFGSTAYFNRNDTLSAYTLNLSSLVSTGSTGSTSVWTAGTGSNSAVLSGSNSVASGSNSVAEGNQTTASGLYSHAEGTFTVASNDNSHAEGRLTLASGNFSHAEGSGTTASDDYTHAEGYNTIANAAGSHAEGNSTQALGNASHAEGSSTIAAADYSHAEGSGTTAFGTYSHSEGYKTTAIGDFGSHSEGRDTTASGGASHTEGRETIASGKNSHAEGFNTRSTGDTSHAEGRYTTSGGIGSHAEGNSTVSTGQGSHAEGDQTTASGNYSHSEGLQTIASGNTSHAEGLETRAFGDYSHAEGSGTTANGTFSHAEGYQTKALGDFGSHSEGGLTTASGQLSHAEGQSTTAIGGSSHAEGQSTIATGGASHAEGYITKSIADYSHAEGSFTTASGVNSHAEGSGTTAAGTASHAEGYLTTASGFYSHAEGDGTIAYGDNSHSEGNTTTALGTNSHAGGKNSSAIGDTSFIHSSGSTVTGARSAVIGGFGLVGSEDDAVYTPKVRSYSGLTVGTLEVSTYKTLNYTEIANNATSNQVVANVNVSRASGLTSNSNARFIGSVNLAYWNKDTTYSLTSPSTTAALVGADTVAWVSATGSTVGRMIGNRSTIISNTSGVTVDNAHYFRANNPDDVGQGMYGIESITGFFMESHALCPGYSAGTTEVWGVYIEDTDAGNYFGDNVWVGTTTGSESLDVNGNGRFRSIGSTASAGALHYTANGTLTTNTSDARLKTNVQTLTGALAKVNGLRGVTYNWSENPTGDTRIGFIAQEVNAVVPELSFVNPNSPEQYMGVHYDNVTALLVEAVKELSSGVTTSNNTHLETQTILAEDNNIDLNYSGTPATAIGGGITVLHAMGQDLGAQLITDNDGNWVTNNDFKSKALTIPTYTPTSSNDETGNEGNITRDDNYLYVKTANGWKRSNLESF